MDTASTTRERAPAVAGVAEATPGGWTIDKRVPVLALLAFLVQFGGFIWYAATENASVQVMQRDTAALGVRTAKLETTTGDLEIVKYRLDNVEKATVRIEAKLDTLGEQARQRGGK